ncbi:MAG TPA: anthrone oxygenase family protein [Terriglobia bacterium]|nr:anthrone oxygenase family protein [Terriglobia bacterium]
MFEIPHVINYLLWLGAVGCGLLGGVYFAFSAFIMTALGRIDPTQGKSAMNSINSTILRSSFMPLFFGTTIVSGALVAVAIFWSSEPGATLMLAGAVIYIFGMTLCTIFFNVPLNNALARSEAANGATAVSAWSRYLNVWTRWNHVRAISSTVTSALYIAAISAR